MKRRTFLSTTGTVGIIGAASSATIVSSAYTSISSTVSLAEFSSENKKTLDHFVSQLTQNIKELGLNKELITQISIPVRVIEKSNHKDNQRIVYKNKFGEKISLSIDNGLETIRFL